ncbi:MAG: IS1634 family transposase [Anaerolineae bacterium]
MFVKKSWRTIKGIKYMYYHIAKAYRDKDGKPKHKTVANLSHLPEEMINQIAILLKHKNAKVISDKYSFFKSSFNYGPIAFFILFMKNLGVLQALKPIPMKSRIYILMIILNRILEPKSKLGSLSWIIKTAIPGLFGIDENKLDVNSIYKAMDIFYQNIDKVMKRFNQSGKEGTRFILYDITSIYFEGEGPDIARNGYSRDNREDRPQILLGLCLNKQGFPCYFRIFPGNVQDKATVIEVMEEVKKKYSVGEYVFVGDRGMITENNLCKLKEIGLGYIVALTHRQAREIINDISVRDLEIFDSQIPVEIITDNIKKEKYILCGSEYRRDHDLMLFEKLIKKGEEALLSVQKMIEAGRIKDEEKIIKRAQKKLTQSGADKYYDFHYENGEFRIIKLKEKTERARKLCGYYILKTTELDMPAEEVEISYKDLQLVENAFYELKNLINIRPIYHWKDRRVTTHVYLCILAQTVVNQCRRKLKQVKWIYEKKENSFKTFIDILSQITMGEFTIENTDEFIICDVKNEHKELLRYFDIGEKEFLDYKKLSIL